MVHEINTPDMQNNYLQTKIDGVSKFALSNKINKIRDFLNALKCMKIHQDVTIILKVII